MGDYIIVAEFIHLWFSVKICSFFSCMAFDALFSLVEDVFTLSDKLHSLLVLLNGFSNPISPCSIC